MTVPSAGGRPMADQGFADALCGPDGTGDPAVLMPVQQSFPDALSAPMPDAMVAVPPVDVAALLAAARQAAPAAAIAPVRQPAPARPTPARRPSRARPPLPVPPARTSSYPTSQRVAPPTRNPVAPAPAGGRPGQALSPADIANLMRSSLTAMTRGTGAAPAPAAPTPPLPRRPPREVRRNKGSSVWAVIVFLVVIAFASGIAQQLFHAISQWLGR